MTRVSLILVGKSQPQIRPQQPFCPLHHHGRYLTVKERTASTASQCRVYSAPSTLSAPASQASP
jgi:hypothetical protein